MTNVFVFEGVDEWGLSTLSPESPPRTKKAGDSALNSKPQKKLVMAGLRPGHPGEVP
jgi:hypothetical protein